MPPFNFRLTLVVLLLSLPFHVQAATEKNNKPQPKSQDISGQDLRAYQHGIDFLTLPDSSIYLLWSSSGNPPTGEDAKGNWTHDIYYSKIDPNKPEINPKILIRKPEAQEPASAAVSGDGHVMVVTEDGWHAENVVAQRFGVYDAQLNPVLNYPRMILDGGHSGHVAATDHHFIVFYADDWVDGGGVADLGTGNDVKAAIYSSSGKLQKKLNIAVGNKTRDWWPLVAASGNRAALVWQRYVGKKSYSQLMLAIVDVENKKLLGKPMQIETGIAYYCYAVAYLPSSKQFLVTGSYLRGGGFAYLFNQQGQLLASNTDLPAMVRESQIIVLDQNGSSLVAQPTEPSGLMLLDVSANSIRLSRTINDSYIWTYSGTDGIFLNPDTLYVVSTSPTGLVEKTFVLSKKYQKNK